MTGTDRVNIATHLREMALSRPHSLAVVGPSGHDREGRRRSVHLTFKQLDLESDALARGLDSIGVARGMRTVLMVKPSLDFFALTFGLFKAGVVPVLIDPGMGVRNLGHCLAEAEPEAFIGSGIAQAVRRLLGWGRATIRTGVTVPPGPPRLWSSEPYPIVATLGDEIAAILFTSGSTGPPKGAVYTHEIFEAQVEILRNLYGIEPGEIDLCTFPLFALFGPALGMTSIIPEMDATRPARVDPVKILAAIQDFGVTNMFGSPALIRRVGDFGAERGVTTPTLRRVISAGAPVPAPVLERFAAMLDPAAQVFTPYGATEALPVCSIGSREVLGETRRQTDKGAGVCVGRPVEGVRVEVIGIADEPIASWSDDLVVNDGEIGELVVSGPIVTRSYFNRPEATALAKIADPIGGFWHRMGDLGYRDDRGRIWFCGRKSHRVATPSGPLFTIPCEAIFNTHPEVARTALVGLGPSGAMRPALCVEPKARLSRGGRNRLRRELLDLGSACSQTREITTILFHKSFPVDVRHNAKIFREKLAVWAARVLE